MSFKRLLVVKLFMIFSCMINAGHKELLEYVEGKVDKPALRFKPEPLLQLESGTQADEENLTILDKGSVVTCPLAVACCFGKRNLAQQMLEGEDLPLLNGPTVASTGPNEWPFGLAHMLMAGRFYFPGSQAFALAEPFEADDVENRLAILDLLRAKGLQTSPSVWPGNWEFFSNYTPGALLFALDPYGKPPYTEEMMRNLIIGYVARGGDLELDACPPLKHLLSHPVGRIISPAELALSFLGRKITGQKFELHEATRAKMQAVLSELAATL